MRPSSTVPLRHRLHSTVARHLSGPLDRLIRRWPWPELGLSHPVVTLIPCRHPVLAGRRAVQLSDLHLDHYRPRHDDIVTRIAGLQPDWIFVTGDLLSTRRGVPSTFRFLSALRAIAPVYVTLGNHDHHSKVPVSHFLELADRHKLTLLVNQTVFVPLQRGERSGELAI